MFVVPVFVVHADTMRQLGRVHAHIGEHGCAQLHEGLLPRVQAMGVLPQEGDLAWAVAQGRHAAIIRPVNELLARPCGFAFQCGAQFIAIKMRFVRAIADCAP